MIRIWSKTAQPLSAHLDQQLTQQSRNLNPGTTAGDIDYYTSSTAKARIAIGTAGQFFKSMLVQLLLSGQVLAAAWWLAVKLSSGAVMLTGHSRHFLEICRYWVLTAYKLHQLLPACNIYF
jgi:hypothetical protein